MTSSLQTIPSAKVLQLDQAVINSLSNPELFSEHWLKVNLWSKQREILQAVFTHKKTAVKACHASSKTFTAALATLCWLAKYEDAIVITTAPTQKQVEQVLWGEIRRLVEKSVYPFPKSSLTKLTLAPKRYAFGFTTSVETGDEGVRFQGFHAQHVLVILDEAPGVDGKIWEAVEGILSAGDTRLLAIGNPTVSSGPFFDAFSINRETWKTMTIGAFDTPNLAGTDIEALLRMSPAELEYSPTDYLISRHWVLDRYKEWGVHHPLWRSRVLGEFPSQAADSLFSLEWLEAAKSRPVRKSTGKGKYYAGIDVAGPGEDETVLVIRCDEDILLLKGWQDPDPRGGIAAELAPYKDKGIELLVDVVGIGWYLARHFEDLGYVVIDVNVGETSNDKEKYSNKKAEYFWCLRMRLEAGDVSGLADDTAIAQLSGIRWKPNARGQIEIESKDKAKQRGVKSPDRAEAVMLVFAPSFQHGLISYWSELAKEVKPEVVNQSTEQKAIGGFTEMFQNNLGTKEGNKTFEKVMIASEQLIICDNCGNRILSVNGDGFWRCGCGRVGNTKPELALMS